MPILILFILITINQDKKGSFRQLSSVAISSRQKQVTMNNSTEVPLNSSSPACSGMVSTMFTLALSVISAAAFIGNILIAATFIKTRSLRTSTNYYIVNMAVSDLLGPVFNWPLYASEGMLTPTTVISEPWATSVCKLGMYFRAVSQVVSVLCLVLITLDRFVAIVFPLKSIMLNVNVRVILLALSWLIPIVYGLPYALFARTIKEEDQTFCRFMMSDSALTVFNGLGITLFYFIPLITILVLYSMIIRVLRKTAKQLKDQENTKRRQQNQRILKIMMSIVLSFFICWTPICIYLFLKKISPALFPKDRCLLLVGFSFYVFPSLSTAVNPVILFVFSTNYNQALKSLCKCICNCFFKASQAKQSATMETQEVNLEMTDTIKNPSQ